MYELVSIVEVPYGDRMVVDTEEMHHLHVNIDAGELPGISYTKDVSSL